MNEKIKKQLKGCNVVYKIGRTIICYRCGNNYFIGKPSDRTVLGATVESEDVADERCMEICERRILAEMKYNNPVAYHAKMVLDALSSEL